MKTALTIAGFDPSSGAGVTADLMVFAAHGLFGTACITSLTVQSTLGVSSTHPVSDEIVGETLECLDMDLRPSGIKIGMVGSSTNIFRICHYLELVNVLDSKNIMASKIPVVLDPIIRSSSGRDLLRPAELCALKEQLLPLVDWVTPNMDELAALLGRSAINRDDTPEACRALQASVSVPGKSRTRLGVITTGGEQDPPNDFLLMPTGEAVWLLGEHVATRSTHGTGCAYSSAFLSRLVLGDGPEQAARAAKVYVSGALRMAHAIGAGRGPVNHLWRLLNVTHEAKDT